jgi:hypothetical protein
VPGAKAAYTLLNNVATISNGAWFTCVGGTYVWTAICATWGSSGAQLQALGPDGVTVMIVANSGSANVALTVNIGDGTQVRAAVISAAPGAGVYSDLRAVTP